jgi:diguanylate cyclase (GGDEF)-like protein
MPSTGETMQLSKSQLESSFEQLNIRQAESIGKYIFTLTLLVILIEAFQIFVLGDVSIGMNENFSLQEAAIAILLPRGAVLFATLLMVLKPRLPLSWQEKFFSRNSFIVILAIVSSSSIGFILAAGFLATSLMTQMIVLMTIASFFYLNRWQLALVMGTPLVISIIAVFQMVAESRLRYIYIKNYLIFFALLFAIAIVNKQLRRAELQKSAEIEKLNNKLHQLATLDSLTGLSNRRAVDQEFNEKIRTRNRHYAVLLVDIDKFKNINDRYGHDCGDYALVKVVEVLKETCRSTDIVGRWGGEEFVIILPEKDSETAKTVAEKIRSEIESRIFNFKDHSFQLTVTVGISLSDEDQIFHNTLAMADKALFVGKESGRNRIILSKD